MHARKKYREKEAMNKQHYDFSFSSTASSKFLQTCEVLTEDVKLEPFYDRSVLAGPGI